MGQRNLTIFQMTFKVKNTLQYNEVSVTLDRIYVAFSQTVFHSLTKKFLYDLFTVFIGFLL